MKHSRNIFRAVFKPNPVVFTAWLLVSRPSTSFPKTPTSHTHLPGLALRARPHHFSITRNRVVMIPLSIAALTNARKSGFPTPTFSDVKTPTDNSADYKQAAADDLGRMGLVARTQGIFYGPATGHGSIAQRWRWSPIPTTTLTASCGWWSVVGR